MILQIEIDDLNQSAKVKLVKAVLTDLAKYIDELEPEHLDRLWDGVKDLFKELDEADFFGTEGFMLNGR